MRLLMGLFISILLGACKTAQPVTKLNVAPVEPIPFLTQIKPLTLGGARSGEGYFSQDGKWIVFQSEREAGNPFYQIYLMNLETRDTKRVSPGIGKTTCAWIHPDQKHILFASTHLDPNFQKKVQEELAIRANPVKQKYSWSFDETYDLFVADSNGKNLKRLTSEKGYDAEGSYSPNGEWIAFASNRLGYKEYLPPEEKELFEKDPSSQMEIYIMKRDGTGVKRLTDHLGYDGGPFFSADGRKIVWRRFNKQGTLAEIYTMNIDGSQQTQVTHMKSMSWAPFFHPSGDYIIFTSNKIGYSNFELYIVDTAGTKEPVRVSFIEGFDGLPVFSPNGQKLVWTHTNEKGETQLYEAEWNDSLARQQLGLGPAFPEKRLLTTAIEDADARMWVNYLASPEMDGRPSGSPQEAEYARAVALAFTDFGLKPMHGFQYSQPFEFTSGVFLGVENDAKFFISGQKTNMQLGIDWLPISISQVGIVPKGQLAFAGYGIVAPVDKAQPAYDSYAGLDVKDKWVVVFRGLPQGITNERRFHLNLYSRLQHKALVARQRGARGLILVNDSQMPSGPLKLVFEGRADNVGLPVMEWSPTFADKMFEMQKTTRPQWTARLAKGEPGTFLWEGVDLEVRIDLAFKKSQGRNVIGELKVPGATKTLMIGAHGDHLGHGDMGNSLARAEETGSVHLGADDNASGVAALMEIAHHLSDEFTAGRFKPKTNVAFAIWSAEEIGILGSTHFLKNAKSLPTAYLNMDMVGRLRGDLSIQGAGSAKEWRSLIEKVMSRSNVPITIQDDPYLPTDSMAFYMKGIPTLSFFTGAHSEYHTPRDTPATLNYPGIVRVASLVEDMTRELAKGTPLTYVKVPGAGTMGGASGGRSFRLYLGTIPDYASEGKQGVLISGTSKDSPAEKAGLKPGDLIVELGGVTIKNIYDYVYCLQSMKANEKTPIKVMRANQVVQLEIVPQMKSEH